MRRMTFPHLHGNERSSSFWIDSSEQTSEPRLASNEEADVAIVGAGIVGITAAYLLAKAGKSVVVLDRERAAMAETGHTTAHLQIVLDTRLEDLVPRFGIEGAKRAWDSQLEAVRFIEQTTRDLRLGCEFERLDAFLSTPKEDERELLAEELRLARKIGYACEWADPSEIPFHDAKHALRFPDQGKFHPRKYLLGLMREAKKLGARFFEGTEVASVEKGVTVTLRTRDEREVRAKWFLSATNVPFVGSETIHTKLDAYRTYVVGARVPRGLFQNALYWDTLDPYHYTRVEPQGDHDLVILGGEDERVGNADDPARAWGKLWEHLQKATHEFTPVHQWSGEIIETADDLPYIGRIPSRGENELMVTGDSGTGMTNGTIGAIMLAERVLGRGTPWDELYDAQRIVKGAKPLRDLLKFNAHAVERLTKRALQGSEIEDVAELRPGDGAVVKRGLKAIAVSRAEDGTLRAVSAACTHVGCTVKWNAAEASWDCPCHGSRFSPTGDILHGPAAKPLARADLDAVLEAREEKVREHRTG